MGTICIRVLSFMNLVAVQLCLYCLQHIHKHEGERAFISQLVSSMNLSTYLVSLFPLMLDTCMAVWLHSSVMYDLELKEISYLGLPQN